jgi:hypothetical protein
VNARDASFGKSPRHGESPKSDDDRRLNQLNLAIQVRLTGTQLLRQWIPIAGGAALDHIRDEYIPPPQTDALQQLLEKLTSRPDKGASLLILVETWCLPDEHDLGIPWPLARYGVRPAAMQPALRALSDLCRQSVQL